MRNLTFILFSILAIMLLHACVTEEGAKQHKAQTSAKQEQSNAQWQGLAYPKPGSKVAGSEVGIFGSHHECAIQVSKHIKEQGMQHGIVSCSHL